jgi:hypothetical protein
MSPVIAVVEQYYNAVRRSGQEFPITPAVGYAVTDIGDRQPPFLVINKM